MQKSRNILGGERPQSVKCFLKSTDGKLSSPNRTTTHFSPLTDKKVSRLQGVAVVLRRSDVHQRQVGRVDSIPPGCPRFEDTEAGALLECASRQASFRGSENTDADKQLRSNVLVPSPAMARGSLCTRDRA